MEWNAWQAGSKGKLNEAVEVEDVNVEDAGVCDLGVGGAGLGPQRRLMANARPGGWSTATIWSAVFFSFFKKVDTSCYRVSS